MFRLSQFRSVLFSRVACLTLLLLVGFGAMRTLAQPAPVQPAPAQSPAVNVVQTPDLGRHFKDLGVEGSIVIYDSNGDRTYEHNPERNSSEITPASTFKIFNAMVALETGVIPDDVAVLTWDGIHRKLGQKEVAEWNHDTNLRQAFKDSTIWFYQILARKAGPERMQQWIDKAGYGNRQIGTAEDIDRFWLQGPLKITPKAQIEFLQRLYREELPFSKRTMTLVKDIMVREQTPAYTLHGKTGWLTSATPNQGWFVGYLEQNKNTYFFATTIDMLKPEDASLRVELTRRSLKDLGLL